jgi:alpha-1,6-mannosyltransferase
VAPIDAGTIIDTSSELPSVAALRPWAGAGLLVVTFGVLLTLPSTRFGYEYQVGEMPVVWLAAGLILTGLLYCFGLPRLISTSLRSDGGQRRLIVLLIIAAGVAARLVLFASEPMLEDDYQRYLWDGAVTANGYNPYAVAPKGTLDDNDLSRVAREAGPVVRRVNHAELKTIYPPVAQAAFALAYAIKPWSLTAWRSVLLAFDLATLTLILLLLREVGRSPIWAALYWWNPLVIKELFNSAHMEAVVLPFVLSALLLTIRKRHVLAMGSLVLAIGAKIWPGLLLPLIVRGSLESRRAAFYATLIFVVLATLWVAPVWLGGLDSNSGFVAYASHWQTNSALFPTLQRATGWGLALAALPTEIAGIAARALIAVCLAGLSIAISVRPIEGPDDLIGRASLVVAALVLLSPAQFPWYVVWFAPFLPFRPWFGFLLLTASAPLYYLRFYFLAAHKPDVFDEIVVWIVWVPVWAALAFEALHRRRPPAAESAANV